jgi:protease PrsW
MQQFLLLLIFIAAAIGLAWYLISQDRGEREPILVLWLAAGFGFLGALMAGFIEGRVLEPENLLPSAPHGALLLTAMAVGIIEEACKFLPLAILIYKKRYFNEHTDGVIYFALAGLGFGLPENIIYTLEYGTKTGLLRLVLTPIFHAATTGLVGYFLAKNKLLGRPFWTVLWALATAMVLHGLYDFGLAAGSGLYIIMSLSITFGVSAGLFVLFLKANQHDQDKGISAVGHNAFCRSCGTPNPKHNLYCAHCGKNA